MTATHVRPMTGIRPSSDARCGKRIEGPTMSMRKWLAVASFATSYSTYAMADSDGPSPRAEPAPVSTVNATPATPLRGAADGATEPKTGDEATYMLTEAVDLWSRFLYRGVLFDDQWTLQPSAAFSMYGVTAFVLASAAPDETSSVDYVGVTVGYAHSAPWGTIGVDLMDSIFALKVGPDGVTRSLSARYAFDFRGDGQGSHWLDVTAYYQGPSRFPLKVQLGALVYNDPDYSKYVGLLYPLKVGQGFTLTPEFGTVISQSRLWYFTNNDPINVTNCALALSRTVDLGRGVMLAATVQFVVNPEAGRVNFVSGIGLHM